MAIRDIFKVSRKTFVNPSAWIGSETIKTQNRVLWTFLKSVFIAPRPEREESFEEAMERLNLTEDDIQAMQQRFFQYTLLFSLLGLVVFLYSFFLLFRYGTFLGWLLGMGAVGLFLSQGFRFDFWGLQLKKRRLGLGYREWLNYRLGEQEDKHD